MELERQNKILLLEEKMKRNALNSFPYFVDKVLNFDKKWDIQQFQFDLMRIVQYYPYLLLLLPRGHGKTELITESYPIWEMCRNPDIKILIRNENSDNAEKYLAAIKDILVNNELLVHLFGEFKSDEKWSADQIVIRQRKMVGMKDSTITVAGLNKSVVGGHYNRILDDDLVSGKNSETLEMIQNVKEFYANTPPLQDAADFKWIIIGTRWHYFDLYNHIEQTQKHFHTVKMAAVDGDLETGKILFPKLFPREKLYELKHTLGSYSFSCNPYEAPILMADWTLKPIGEVKAGDEVVGYTLGKGNRNGHLIKTKVIANGTRVAPIQKMYMESGRTIRCTPDHHWYTGRSGSDTHKSYLPATVGRELLEVVDITTPDDIRAKLPHYMYLAGIIDGEGACKYGSVFIHQSQSYNPQVKKRIRDTVKLLGLPYTEKSDYLYFKGGLQTKFDLIRFANPAKSSQIANSLFNENSGKFIKKRDRVKKIEYDTEDTVYSLQTESGNYIVWGYASKNCQYLNNPVDDKDATFKHTWIEKMFEPVSTPSNMNVFIAVDPAISQEKRSDFTSICVVGIDEHKHWHILKLIRDKLTLTDIIDNIFLLDSIYHPVFTGIEMNSFQKVLQYEIQKEEENRGVAIPFEGFSTHTNKQVRIRALQPLFERGEIHCARDLENSDILEFELLSFPKGEHEDTIDTLASILKFGFSPDEQIKEEEKIQPLSWQQLLFKDEEEEPEEVIYDLISPKDKYETIT